MSEFKIFRLPPAGPPRSEAAIDGDALTEAAIAELEGEIDAPAVLSRTPLPGQKSRGRDLELIRGRGRGGCSYIVAGYIQDVEPQYVRGYVDEDEEIHETQTVTVRRR